ncbi:hypothetical protein DFH06DRAFT_1328390 [Mycena polygramma]|nr:hypothetical protein DFH06DRAFT_1340308 [Mycena polygramma]KAJ7656845.1 hypothetical protein DFH06DRAFT_1328390 [Mycena polygramma]
MPLLSGSGALSIAERIAQRAAADPAIQKALDNPPTGTFYRTLAPPTIHGHDVVKRLWRGFAENHDPNLPPDIVPDTPLPLKDTLYEFAQYLSLGCKGLLAVFPQKKSIEKYIRNLFVCWKRYAFLPAPDTLKTSVFAYINSPELAAVAPLTTAMRPKPVPTRLDIEAIIRAAYEDNVLFRTNRMRIQFIAITLASVETSERPGAIMESDSYTDTNETLFWGGLHFLVFPNLENPHLPPLLGIRVDIDLLKAWRKDDSKRKSFFFRPEPLGNRALCLVTLFSTMAQQDQVWEDVESVREILHPKTPPTAVHELVMKESARKQPVFRADVLTSEGWTTSETAALKARTNRQLIKNLLFKEGFVTLLVPPLLHRADGVVVTWVVAEATPKKMPRSGIFLGGDSPIRTWRRSRRVRPEHKRGVASQRDASSPPRRACEAGAARQRHGTLRAPSFSEAAISSAVGARQRGRDQRRRRALDPNAAGVGARDTGAAGVGGTGTP